MKKYLKPSEFNGKLKAPPSKSHQQRIIAAGLLKKGNTFVSNFNLSNDNYAAMLVAKSLGANIRTNMDKLEIVGQFKPNSREINCSESGFCARLFSAIASLHNEEIIINGKGSLLKRPFSMIEEPLQNLGVECETNNGYLPIKVKGPMTGGRISLKGDISSQFLSGLLMALPLAKKDSVLFVENLKSKPYIDLTIKVLSDYGILIGNNDYKSFFIKGNQEYHNPKEENKDHHITVEGDWSNTAFLLVGGAISGKVEIDKINMNSTQGDKAIIEVLKKVGAKITIENNYIIAEKDKLKPFKYNATETPDLFPPLIVLASYCNGISIIEGVGRLIHKESNRAEALKSEFGKLGVTISINEEKDTMQVKSFDKINGGVIDSHNDHRIAMAGAIASLGAHSDIEIEGAECVNKSYPEFFKDFNELGGKSE